MCVSYGSPISERVCLWAYSAEDFTVDSPSADSDDENIQLASPVRNFSRNVSIKLLKSYFFYFLILLIYFVYIFLPGTSGPCFIIK